MQLSRPRSKSKTSADPRTALVLDTVHDEVIVARPDAGGQIAVERVARDGQGPAVQTSQARTATFLWGAFSERLQSGDISSQAPDDQTTRTLLELLEQSGDELLRGSLEDFCVGWARTNDGGLTLTTAPRHIIDRASAEIRRLVLTDLPPEAQPLTVETPTRALARYWLTERARAGELPKSGTVAFLIMAHDGFAIGLWSAQTGLVIENEQPLDASGDLRRPIRTVCDTLAALVSQQSLSEVGLPALSLVVVSCAQLAYAKIESYLNSLDLFCDIEQLADSTGYPVEHAEAIARGLLGDYALIPVVDLADDIRNRVERIHLAEMALAEQGRLARMRTAMLALLAPLLIVLSACLASYFYLHNQQGSLERALASEKREAARLAEVQANRNAAEKHFNWYVTVTNQIIELRKKQPATVQMLVDLNGRWPAGDPSWYVTDLRAQASGVVEIKGKTRSEESVKSFATALEFGGGFSAVQPEMKITLPKQTPNGPPVALETPGSQVIDFTVKATYGPFVGASYPARPVIDPTQITPPAIIQSPAPPAAPPASGGRP